MEHQNTEIIHSTDVYRLHYAGGSGYPCLIIPPHAGRHGNVVDRLAERCAKHRTTYIYELLPATQEIKHTNIGDLCRCIHVCTALAGGIVDLVGVCQGGWLAAIYAALHPRRINSMALMAAPIDIQAAPDNITAIAGRSIPREWYRMVVSASGGVQMGINQWLAFAMVNPAEVFWGRWQRLAWAMFTGDEATVAKLRRNNDWYDSPQDLAGAWYLQAMEDLFIGNKLIAGDMIVSGSRVDLSQIMCPVYLYAGAQDEITAPEQLFSVANVLPQGARKHILENAGHTKVFTGTEELTVFENSFLEE